MLQVMVAPPRSGKTYYCVNYLVGFCKYDKVYHEYILNPDVLIIANIEGLKIKHWRLADCLAKMPIEKFFSIANFEEIQKRTGKTHIILCIDEAHEIFHKGFSNLEVYKFFAYHGHIGLDVIFMTQGLQEFTRSFNPLFEFVVHVTQRSRSVAGAFSYTHRTVGGMYLRSEVLRKKQLVFDAYKSFRVDEKNKPKNALLMWAFMVCCILGVGFGLFKFALGTVKDKSVAAAEKQKAFDAAKRKPVDLSKSNSPVASSVPPGIAPASPVSASVAPAVVDPSPVVVSGPPPDPRSVLAWRVYHVQGYIDTGKVRGYLINGRVVLSGTTRNYDPLTSSVEVYSGLIPDKETQRGGDSSSPPKASFVGLSPVSAAEGGALAQPAPSPDTAMVFPIKSDPINSYPRPDPLKPYL